MIVIELKGGLGNQLFQYFTARSISLKCGQELYISNDRLKYDWQRKEYLSKIINRPIKTVRLKRKFIQDSIRINEGNYDSLLNAGDFQNIIVHGYWQDERYFHEHANIIRDEVDLNRNIIINHRILQNIQESNSIAIHIRRGDYVNHRSTKIIFGNICTMEYYTRAINYLKEKVINPEFYIFSDDPEWCKRTFTNEQFDNRLHFLDSRHKSVSTRFDNNYFVRNILVLFKQIIPDRTLNDFSLMANCKHFIVANSTFSWWAAWLSENKEKIVCTPAKWDNLDKDRRIIPESWTKIPV